MYLDYKTTLAPALWADIRGGVTNETQLGLLLGGEASMWQDFYVPGARSKAQGSARYTVVVVVLKRVGFNSIPTCGEI